MKDDSEKKLFQPINVGAFELRNRIVMAPVTRCRTEADTLAPLDIVASYYGRRASAGLIVGEGVQISQQGQGYYGSTGIYSDAQVDGWKNVTRAVHEVGGCMVPQLWHVGRVSHPSLQPGGALPVAPSAVLPKGKTLTADGSQDMVVPRALELSEIPGIIAQYAHAARNAQRAGFDGVEIHGANGYLLDQFLRDGANKREDKYGGSIENRSRLMLEVVDAVCTVWDKKRVGIRLSPLTNSNDMSDSDPQPLFNYLIERLNLRDIAFIHMVEGNTGRERDVPGFDYSAARKLFKGSYIVNNGYTRTMAIDAVESGAADLVSFGRPFISNPDLVERLRQDLPLKEHGTTHYYRGGEVGYF
ncbi:MAG: alkene reductase [Alphaproteobacteria bacterium]|nr:alkene reductase [Alphaproteobacteria bacterium]